MYFMGYFIGVLLGWVGDFVIMLIGSEVFFFSIRIFGVYLVFFCIEVWYVIVNNGKCLF